MAAGLSRLARYAGRDAVAGQFIRFAGIGVIATGVHYAILVALVSLTAMRAAHASSAGFVLSAVLNYYLNHRYTFRSGEKHGAAVAKFCLVAAAGLALNYAVMEFAVERLSLHYLLSQVGATLIVLLWNFSANRIWVFRVGARGR